LKHALEGAGERIKNGNPDYPGSVRIKKDSDV